MYELRLYNFLEKQYFALIKDGILQLEANWNENPKSIKMKSFDQKFYSLLIAQFYSGCTEIYTPEVNRETQKMIFDFFMICQKYVKDLREYFSSHGYGEDLVLNAPNELSYEAAENCKMDMTAFLFRLSSKIPLKKQYTLLKLKGYFSR